MDATTTIKPIETFYKGYRFRSRLEARWAVFFDAASIIWIYEFEGYDLPNTGYYLPDFWLPELHCFAEIKPKNFTKDEFANCKALPSPCILLDTSTPKVFYPYFSTALYDTCSFDYYLNGSDYGRIILLESQAKKRLWFLFGEHIQDYWLDREPEIKARSARFEFGENGL